MVNIIYFQRVYQFLLVICLFYLHNFIYIFFFLSKPSCKAVYPTYVKLKQIHHHREKSLRVCYRPRRLVKQPAPYRNSTHARPTPDAYKSGHRWQHNALSNFPAHTQAPTHAMRQCVSGNFVTCYFTYPQARRHLEALSATRSV